MHVKIIILKQIEACGILDSILDYILIHSTMFWASKVRGACLCKFDIEPRRKMQPRKPQMIFNAIWIEWCNLGPSSWLYFAIKELTKEQCKKKWGQMPHRLLYILELFILNIDIYPIYLLIPKIDNDASRKRHKHVHIFVIHQNVTK